MPPPAYVSALGNTLTPLSHGDGRGAVRFVSASLPPSPRSEVRKAGDERHRLLLHPEVFEVHTPGAALVVLQAVGVAEDSFVEVHDPHRQLVVDDVRGLDDQLAPLSFVEGPL